jgi:very-short-patch-repair endonuclease
MDWVKVFSPIEYMMWCDIRNYNMRMWPQYPIGKYFADFANVEHKVVIECDGKMWHNQELDAVRDAFMIEEGWTVYRISGAECFRVAEREEYAEHEEEENKIYIEDLYRSSHGLVKAIFHFHYGKSFAMSDNEERTAEHCLHIHRATGIYNFKSRLSSMVTEK